MTDALSELEFPHWLMVAGAVLMVLGFIGFAFSDKIDDREPTATKAKGK
jgi:hypothetical protein